MTQLEFGHLVKILPVVKDGKPIVAGGYEYIKQSQRYKDVFGNFFNPLSDALKSYSLYEKELVEFGKTLGVNTYNNSFSLKKVLVRWGSSGVEFLSDGLISAEYLNMYVDSTNDPKSN